MIGDEENQSDIDKHDLQDLLELLNSKHQLYYPYDYKNNYSHVSSHKFLGQVHHY